jgi:hypothetical protein
VISPGPEHECRHNEHVTQEKPHDAPVHRGHRNGLIETGNDKNGDTHGRRDHADIEELTLDGPEPDGVETELYDERVEDRQRQKLYGRLIHESPHDNVDNNDDGHNTHRRQIKPCHSVGKVLRQVTGGAEVVEDHCADYDTVYHTARLHAFEEGLFRLCPGQFPSYEGRYKSTEGADSPCFRGGKDADNETANGCDDEEEQFPYLPKGFDLIDHCYLFPRRSQLRFDPTADADHKDIRKPHDNTGNDAAYKELGDGVLCNNTIDDKDAAWGDKASNGATSSETPVRQGRIVLAFLHLRQGDKGHRHCRGISRGTDGPEGSACA